MAADTAIFIYFIEEHPKFLPAIAPLFEEADLGLRRVVTSALTLLEVLVVPYRRGSRALANRYEAILTKSRGIQLVDITREQLRLAAQIRAGTRVKSPDALQLSAAITTGCKAFVTNDRDLPTIAGLRIVQVDSYIA